MPWPQTGATQYHAQLGLPDKGRAIKGLVVCNSIFTSDAAEGAVCILHCRVTKKSLAEEKKP